MTTLSPRLKASSEVGGTGEDTLLRQGAGPKSSKQEILALLPTRELNLKVGRQTSCAPGGNTPVRRVLLAQGTPGF